MVFEGFEKHFKNNCWYVPWEYFNEIEEIIELWKHNLYGSGVAESIIKKCNHVLDNMHYYNALNTIDDNEKLLEGVEIIRTIVRVFIDQQKEKLSDTEYENR